MKEQLKRLKYISNGSFSIQSLIILIVVLYIIPAFPAPMDKNHSFISKYRKQLDKSIQTVFDKKLKIQWISITLSPAIKNRLNNELKIKKISSDTLMIGKITYLSNSYWIIVDEAPSKTQTFLYALYLTEAGEIFNVDVLIYRENYGYEIDHPAFRKQFQGKKKARELIFGRNIQNITGATISARSLTYAVRDWLKIFEWLKPQLQNGEKN